MAFIFGRKSKKKVSEATVTQTLMVSLKKNRIVEAPHKKKTTFLELLFDLAVVFVFAMLSSKFAEYIGISPKGFIGGHESIEVTHSEVGLLFWVINFIALWQVWYRYGVLFRNYGNEGVTSHMLTFVLILGVGVQAITLSINSEFFTEYGLLISFAISKGMLWLFEIIIVYNAIRSGDSSKKNVRKILFETIGIAGFVILVIVYAALVQEHKIALHWDGDKHDDWQIELAVSVIIMIAVVLEWLITMLFHTQTTQMNEMTVYAHTKERHHLLVIIALGESILFNVGTDVANDTNMLKMIPDLVLNLVIVMWLWFLYKSYVYRMSYQKGMRNVTVFSIVHIFIIAGMMLMFSSLEGFAESQTEYDKLIHDQSKFTGGQASFIALEDLKHSMNFTFPSIYLFGFGIFLASLIAMIWIPKFGREPYDKVVQLKRARTSYIWLLIILAGATVFTLLMMGVEIELRYIFVGMLGIFAIEFVYNIFLTNKFMLKVAGSEEKAIEELEKLEK